MAVSMKSDNREKSLRKNLAEVFFDTESHLKVARIILDHLINYKDIRNIALEGIEFSNVRKILDLGCGFGYFTRGLKYKVSTDTKIVGVDCYSKYRDLYLQACAESEIQGDFVGSGIAYINTIASDSIDLILCSYALYFFPDYIDQISRILKPKGIIVAITHARPHMKEFTRYVKDLLYNAGIDCQEPLPYESLIRSFSNENGEELLRAKFEDVTSINYNGQLLFKQDDFESLKTYFEFKRSFFIPCLESDIDKISTIILEKLEIDLKRLEKFEISKNDIIFIGKGPKN
jgi:ubiquinone/menaquinone biosynthesis C-methylase UbiE